MVQPYKTINTEYLVWSEFTLIAYIGGMLGLTLGFSFPGLLEWTFNWISLSLGWSYKTRAKKRVTAKQGRMT